MLMLSKRIHQEMDYQPNDKVPTYQNDNVVIFKPEITVNKEVAFNYYHFILPLKPLPTIEIDKRKFEFEKKKILVTNPGQKLKIDVSKKDVEYYAIFVKKSFVENISKAIYRKSTVDFSNGNYSIDQYLLTLLRRFAYENVNQQKGYHFVLDCLGSEIVTLFLRTIKSNINLSIIKRYSANENINRSIEYLHTFYDKDIYLEELASIANLSPYYFIRIFKSETGMTPFEYLLDLRIKKAKDFLKLKEYKIIEVGELCGFTNPAHFSTVFKKEIGIPPGQYRKKIQE